MRTRRVLLLGWVAVWSLIVATPAWPILIETKGASKRRVAGYVESDDGTTLVLRIPTESGKFRKETHTRAKIKILHRVDRGTLAKLSRDNAAGYREYAEELADSKEGKEDPEAIDMAMRLFVIAAYLDPAKHGPACLLRMSALATNPSDQRKYRAMAFLLDSKQDPSLLALPGQAPADVSEAAWQALQQALRKYRNGQVIEARDLVQSKGLSGCFHAVAGMTQDSFVQACTDAICPHCKYTNRNKLRCATCGGKGRNPFNNFQFCQNCNGKGFLKCSTCNGNGVNRTRLQEHTEAILRMELAVLNRLVPDAPAGPKRVDSGNWSSALSNPQVTPVPALTLETITDYDPRKCVYRDGKWIAP